MWNRRTVYFPWFRFKWDLRWGSQQFELWWDSGDKLLSFSTFWNRFFKPSAWWWFHNNGAIKGVDNCYDFNWNLFIFHFNYTNFGFWRYKKGFKK